MQKPTKLLFFSLCLLVSGAPDAWGQRIVGELESNADMSMVPGDTIDGGSQKGKKKKRVPTEVRAWTVDPVFGNRTETFVDTLRHQFQNCDHSEGRIGQYNTLANLGSPRLSRLYMERADNEDFIFVQPFDQFYVSTERFRYYNTKSPYMNLTYNWGGSKNTGSDHFRALYTNNAGKRLNFGGIYDYFYGQGYYAGQSTSFMNATAFASYLGERYDFHFRYTHNYMKMGENGGITDEKYITNPEGQSTQYKSDDMPTNLTKTWGKQEHDIVFFNQRYHVGFTRMEGDSTHRRAVFVPVTSFFHTLSVESFRRAYIAHNRPMAFHSYDFLPGDSANDHHKMVQVKNLFGVSLREGFNKYAVAGLNAYVGLRNTRHTLPSLLVSGTDSTIASARYGMSDVLVGGQLIRTQGKAVHYNVDAEIVVAGDYAGDLRLKGHGELNLPLPGDTAQVAVDALATRAKPNFYYEHFHAKHAWWDNDMSPVTRTRIEGRVTLPKTRSVLTVGIENVKNYTYFANDGTSATASDGTAIVTNNAVARQCGDNIQVVSARLQQDFKLGPLHLDNDITYQTTTDKDVLPLPTLSTYHNLYLDFKIAKVLSCELGADVKFFTEYYAPDYSPVIGQFTTQNPGKRIKIGNYPLVSAYANLSLKRTRFYIQYYHINQSDGRYFWAPFYPMNPKGLHFGISWNFYD